MVGLSIGNGATAEGNTTMSEKRSVDRRQSFGAVEKRKLGAFLTAHDPFRAIRQTMPMQYVVTFLLVCLEEGKGVTEYAQQAGVPQSVMSRHLLDLGDKARDGTPGFGLVTLRQDPLNLRRHQCLLTDKGRAVGYNILRALGGA
jgi:DNA-binding MarR family transcriptional regulator